MIRGSTRLGGLAASCLLAACAAAGRPHARPADELPAKELPADELIGVCRAQEQAWNQGDIEAFMARGYWRSPELTFLSGSTWTRGYEPVLERYRARYATGAAEMGKLSFSELEAERLADDVGLVRGRWALVFTDGRTLGGLFTLLLRRLPEGWRIVHDHTS